MSGYALVAVVLLVFLAVLGFFWWQPPEISEIGCRRFLKGITLSAVSAVLLAADFAIVISINLDFIRWRPYVFWVAFPGFWVNAAALFSFLHPLWSILPFAKGDASDVSAAGITFGLMVFFMQVVWAFFWFLCLFAP